jgi:hypothetical protein
VPGGVDGPGTDSKGTDGKGKTARRGRKAAAQPDGDPGGG